MYQSRVLFKFNRGYHGTAKCAIYLEISRNLPFRAKNHEICLFPGKNAILTFYRDKSRVLPLNYNEIFYM